MLLNGELAESKHDHDFGKKNPPLFPTKETALLHCFYVSLEKVPPSCPKKGGEGHGGSDNVQSLATFFQKTVP